MRRICIALTCLFLLTAAFLTARQARAETETVPGERAFHCRDCHDRDVPTAREPGLKPCPRSSIITLQHAPETAPEFIPMNPDSDQYAPVQFTHRKHAEMAQMSGGCGSCHHYNKWSPVQACRNCHPQDRQREDLSRPDLKGAYHRLCAGCHESFSEARDCHFCHASKTAGAQPFAGAPRARIAPPTDVIFETEFDEGKFIVFTHKAHASDYEISCADCHTQDNCSTCHRPPVEGQGTETLRITKPRPEERHHQPCFTCHEDDDCTRCHRTELPASR